MAIKLLKSEKDTIVHEIIKQLNPVMNEKYKKEVEKEFVRLNRLKQTQELRRAVKSFVAVVPKHGNWDLERIGDIRFVKGIAEKAVEDKGLHHHITSHEGTLTKKEVLNWLEFHIMSFHLSREKFNPKAVIKLAVKELGDLIQEAK